MAASAAPANPTSPDGELKLAPDRELKVTELEVRGFEPAVLLVPSGSAAQPLVVAAHGAGGSAEWECDYWARLTRSRAFVLCLRGTAMGNGAFYFKNHYALGAELRAALTAARAAQPRIAPHGAMYAGFSQGASMGSLMIADQGRELPLVVLIEGFEQWNVALGRRFVQGGGEKVLFVCGTSACAGKAQLSVQALERAGAGARLSHAVGAGHTPLGAVRDQLEQQLPWLLGDTQASD